MAFNNPNLSRLEPIKAVALSTLLITCPQGEGLASALTVEHKISDIIEESILCVKRWEEHFITIKPKYSYFHKMITTNHFYLNESHQKTGNHEDYI